MKTEFPKDVNDFNWQQWAKNNSFHNTVGVSGKILMNYENNAQSQEDKILDYLQALPLTSFTTDELLNNLFAGTKVPIQSIRRACTNLEKSFKIIKCGKKMGSLGVNINAYKVI